MAQIFKISGPVVVADNFHDAKMYDVVRVGNEELIGEIISIERDKATIQVYEETSGLRPGEPVVTTGRALSVELGPGLISSIYDGIQRPLDVLAKKSDFIGRGVTAAALNREKKWKFVPSAKKGQNVSEGDVLGIVQENEVVKHKILVPHGVKGKVESIEDGSFTVEDTVCVVNNDGKKEKLTMMQRWEVRHERPYKEKLPPIEPLITGQRILDTFFPIAKGGSASIPGGFGTGKTVTQHQLAKWSDADIVVYVGCGERGNEMTEVLDEFPKLIDQKTGLPLMKRTILLANTSNMPVAAREASIYVGITLAEYYRDMGYDVALMADSTSRWAEAMREISSRMEEMPGEEGYPAYLARKLAEFYERAGKVVCLGSEKRNGSVSIIGAVSPPGGDITEPVSQNTLRVTKAFWALDSKLAQKRHFPSINWLKSYSLYLNTLAQSYSKLVSPEFPELRMEAMALLQKEAELQEIVQLVGPDALPEREQVVLETSKMIREDFLQQSAYHEVDTYTSMKKQYLMLKTILHFHKKALEASDLGVKSKFIAGMKVKDLISRMKEQKEEGFEKHAKELAGAIDKETDSLIGAGKGGKK